jgi:hypothetical protein
MLLALSLSTGCWGTPRLAIRGAQTAGISRFEFSYCKDPKQSPPLVSIEVAELDAAGGELEPPVCRLQLEPSAGTAPVPGWSYGAELPSLGASHSCPALQAGHAYRVSIQGGGVGSEVFTISDADELRPAGESCR